MFFFFKQHQKKHKPLIINKTIEQNIVKMLSILLFLVFLHIVAMMIFEKLDFMDSLWLTMTTIMTVGYGDLSAKTHLGRISTMLLMYVGGIYTLANFVTQYLDLLSSIREKKWKGLWRWKMEDFILIIGSPEQNAEEYFIKLAKQLHASKCSVNLPILLVTNKFSELPMSLADLGVVHYNAKPSLNSTLEAININKAHSIVILANSETDVNCDSYTFDLIHRIRETKYSGKIIAECVESENKQRLINIGATSVIRPMRGFPEMVVRAIVSEGSEKILENLFDSEGDECLKIDINKKLNWREMVISCLDNDLGTPIAVLLKNGDVVTNPVVNQLLDIQSIFIISRHTKDNLLTKIKAI